MTTIRDNILEIVREYESIADQCGTGKIAYATATVKLALCCERLANIAFTENNRVKNFCVSIQEMDEKIKNFKDNYVKKDKLYLDEDVMIDVVSLCFGRSIEIKKCEEIAQTLNGSRGLIIKSEEDL